MKKINLSFQDIKNKAPAAFLAAATGYGIFQFGEDYGEYKTYQQLDYRTAYSFTDSFIVKSCPQLSQTDIGFGFIKREENIKTPAFSFVLGEISQDKDIPVLSEDKSNDMSFVFIDSPGGSAIQKDTFLQQLKSRSKKIVTIVNGDAASAAFAIAISGSPGYRLATYESELMSHEASIRLDGSTFQESDLPYLSFDRWALIHTNNELKSMIKDASPSLSEECINALVRPKTDMYISVIDALKLGLIDAVVPTPEMMGSSPQGTPAMVRKGNPREVVLEPGLGP